MQGLKRASFDALMSRGPWRIGKGNFAKLLTATELRAFYEAIPDVPKMCAALGVDALSDRKADRALHLLKGQHGKPGTHFIYFERGRGGGWRRIEDRNLDVDPD